ncbi:hypothetical protein Taro_054879, partial [Colocasia esculenta]|nr:hypothetical protein [Colocasia esculenta]
RDSLDYANRWQSPHAPPPSHSHRKSCSTRCEISSPNRVYGCPNIVDIVTPSGLFPPLQKESSITFRTGIGIAYVTTIRNRHSETVDRALVSRNSVPGLKYPPERVSDSLDYANRWRSPHAPPPSHSHRKSCSTQREISSSGRVYGCPNIADIVTPSGLFPPLQKESGITFRTDIGIAYVTIIRNRHSMTVDRALVSWNSVPGPKYPPERRLPRLRESLAEPTCAAAQSQPSKVVFNSTRDLLPSSDSLDYANRWRSPHAPPPSHSHRKSCSTRRMISSPGRVYGCPNIADIVTPSGLFPPLLKESSITFRTGIGIAYVTTIRSRHSETVDRALVSRNSVPGPKCPPERVY